VGPDRVTLPAEFYDRPVLAVARDLLGALVDRETPQGMVTVRLTEVEAYDGANDPGSHAFRGRTPRNATMFGPPGHLYVYFTYGMHWCMNLVCAPPGSAAAVLLRAGRVVAGAELARLRRPGASDRDLARGPARLTKALGGQGVLDGTDVTQPTAPLRVRPGATVPIEAVAVGPRTGVAGGGAGYPGRFAVLGDPTVSAYRPAVARRRLRNSSDARQQS
jgi:DNA-3-methyladenine glycosylase